MSPGIKSSYSILLCIYAFIRKVITYVHFGFERNDWGAILLIDERFGKSPKYRNGKYFSRINLLQYIVHLLNYSVCPLLLSIL